MADVKISLYSSSYFQYSYNPTAWKLLARHRGRRVCALAVLRMYGGVIGAPQHYIPELELFITECNTLGFVDLTKGTAWDSTVVTPVDVLAVGVGQYPDSIVEAPPQWQYVRLGLPQHDDWDPDLLSDHRYKPQNWQRPVLRAVGLKGINNTRMLPRRTLYELVAGQTIHPIPPWIAPEIELTTTDWLPLSQDQRTQLELLLGRYQLMRMQRWPGQSRWQAQVSEYLVAAAKLAQNSDQVIEGLLNHLIARIGLSRQEIINALPREFFDPVDVDAPDEQGREIDIEREVCEILYPQGPIYLNMPAADSQDYDSSLESRRAFYRRRGLEFPYDRKKLLKQRRINPDLQVPDARGVRAVIQ